ncbi:MAG TPA: thioredoxin family protein [Spirochaetota bacterium]|nr:thioredoxin family protein [Spirochaetota bacterium]
MKKIFTYAVITASVFVWLCGNTSTSTDSITFAADRTLYYFYGKGCPHCKEAASLVDRFSRQYRLQVKKYEVWYNVPNRNRLLTMGRERGVQVKGVPTIIMGKDVYTGKNAGKIEGIIRRNVR